MQLIRCTQKLLKEMGLKKTVLNTSEPVFSYLGSWHANLLHIDGKKCVLFVNDKTLFNFLAPNVKRQQIKNLSDLFNEHLAYALSSENITDETKEKIISEYSDINYATTNNKKVLGSMNDLAFHYKHHILSEGGIFSALIPIIINKLNHMPMGAIGYKFASEELKLICESTI
jgi:hypothetical protein